MNNDKTGAGFTITFAPALGHGATITLHGTTDLTAPNTTIDGHLGGDGSTAAPPDVLILGDPGVPELRIRSDHDVLRNLAMQGPSLDGPVAHDDQILNSYLGTDVDGKVSLHLVGTNGVQILDGAHNNTIKGDVIAGNADPNAGVGVFILNGAHDNVVQDNKIGVNVAGQPVPNSVGVKIGFVGDAGDSGNLIGGTRPAAGPCTDPCNVISGNGQAGGGGLNGVWLDGTGATTTTVQGNNIGVDATGAISVSNGRQGILVDHGASGNTIGGNKGAAADCSGPCNLISGNGGDGILITDTGTMRNTVAGNFVGVDVTGAQAVANTELGGVGVGGQGVAVAGGASGNTIGGDKGAAAGCSGPCNLISGNETEGILITGTGTMSNAVAGNDIGLDATGAISVPNGGGAGGGYSGYSGVAVASGAAQTTIGGAHSMGTCDGRCNLISGNSGSGLVIADTGTISTTVQGNFIGLDETGATALPNGTGTGGPNDGLALVNGTARNTIGGPHASGDTACDGPCNVISGNAAQGILIRDGGTISNTVQGNNIGVDATGAISVSNGQAGILLIFGATQNTIGGTRPLSDTACDGPCNVISGNGQFGVALASTSNDPVQGNYIGLDATGAITVPNGANGVLLTVPLGANGVAVGSGVTGETIGGTRPPGDALCDGPCNVISGNGGDGVALLGRGTTGNTVAGNYIGAQPGGTGGLGNGGAGVSLKGGATQNTIGGAGSPGSPVPASVSAGLSAPGVLGNAAAALVAGPPVQPTPSPATAVGPPTPAPARASPNAAGTEQGGDDPRAREEWFVQQRAYPLKHIPAGARLRALAQLAALRRTLAAHRRSAAPAAAGALGPWTQVGGPSQQGGDWGPVGGRVTSLVLDPRDTSGNTLFAGTADGGVWKTTNGAFTWTPTMTGTASLAIGAMAVDTSTTPSTIYAATGEGNGSIDSYYGVGLLKSTDGGVTWALTGPQLANRTVGALTVDPITPTILYAAAGNDGTRNRATPPGGGGIYRSVNGGGAWSLVLQSGTALGGGTSVPACPGLSGRDAAVVRSGGATTIYATLDGCGANSVYRSTDHGATWTRLTAFDTAVGAPVARIAVAVAPSNPQIVYAAAANPNGTLQGVYESTDGGTTWAQLPQPTDNGAAQYWYDFYLAVDPSDATTLYLGGLDAFQYAGASLSNPASGTWTNLTNVYTHRGSSFTDTVHPDQHALAFAPDGVLYAGNDGGVYRGTTNFVGIVTWTDRSNGIGAIQLYGASVSSPGGPLRVYRAAQDNGITRYDGSGPWIEQLNAPGGGIICGDGTLAAVDPTNASIAYAECQNSLLKKTVDDGTTWTAVTNANTAAPANPGQDPQHEWVTPFVLDPAQPARVLMGTNRVWESTDGAASWHLLGSGANLTLPFGNISALALGPAGAPCTQDTLYIGSSLG